MTWLGLALARSEPNMLVVTLRDGKKAILPLPSQTSAISLQQLSKQLEETTEELILKLAAETFDKNF